MMGAMTDPSDHTAAVGGDGEAESPPQWNDSGGDPELAAQRKVADDLGVDAAHRHIFLCCDQTKPKCSDSERSLAAWDYLKRRLKELGVSERGHLDPAGRRLAVNHTKANCLRICQDGPIALLYPEGAWYRRCDPPVLEAIIQRHLLAGQIVTEHLIREHPLPGSERV
jgi:(2Fe-2S) ferredoxin